MNNICTRYGVGTQLHIVIQGVATIVYSGGVDGCTSHGRTARSCLIKLDGGTEDKSFIIFLTDHGEVFTRQGPWCLRK